VGNGTLKESTKKYEHIIDGYGVDKWGAKDFDGKEFMKGLASIQALPICQGCLKGGGNEECKIRPCASNKKISDCIECNERSSCKNFEALQKVRTGALHVGMLVKTDDDKARQQQLIKKWTAELKKKWPSYILFLRE
jgi:flavodoxin